eukprot:GHVR01051832.1.p1 GENE.GHVR01051832.1~~GHVR01051832.1.p1  ORF type:complete len:302 (+),score=7.14 GHVR01051832.1:69-974(+)
MAPKSSAKRKPTDKNKNVKTRYIYHNGRKRSKFRLCPMWLVDTLGTSTLLFSFLFICPCSVGLNRIVNRLFGEYHHTHIKHNQKMPWDRLLFSKLLKGYLDCRSTRQKNSGNSNRHSNRRHSTSGRNCSSSKLDVGRWMNRMSIEYLLVDDFPISFDSEDEKEYTLPAISEAFLQFLVDTLMDLGFSHLLESHVCPPMSVLVSHQPDTTFDSMRPYASTMDSRPDSRLVITITKDGKQFSVSVHQGEVKKNLLLPTHYPQWLGDFISCLIHYMRHISPDDILLMEVCVLSCMYHNCVCGVS